LTFRVLTISKPYVAAAYRQKVLALSELDGAECGLICPEQWGNQSFEPDSSSDSKYWLKRLPIVFNGKNHFHYYRGLDKAIREFKPDLINIEEEHYSFVTFQVARIANKMKVPYVFYTWQNLHKRYPPPFSWIEKYIFATCSGGITGNCEAIEVLKKKGYSRLVREIPQMGISWNQFTVEKFPGGKSAAIAASRRALNLPQDKMVVGYVGRFVEEKGLEDLVQAATLLDPNLQRKILFVLLGNGPFQARLDELMKKKNVRQLFEVRSFVPSNEVARYMQAMDVLCLPSRTRNNWKEQFGRVLIEAMAAEAVVLGSSSGEIPNVIGNDGLVFQEQNPEALAEALRKCLEDPDLLRVLAKRAATKAKSKFTHDAIALQFFELFQEILGRR